MFKRAMKPGLESVFTHKERSNEEGPFAEIPPISPGFVKESPETTISPSVSIEGRLIFERFLRINGSFIGELVGEGRLHIGPTGYIKADIHLESALIEGHLEGNIQIAGHLELASTAIIKGDITAKTMTVHPGATLSGQTLIN